MILLGLKLVLPSGMIDAGYCLMPDLPAPQFVPLTSALRPSHPPGMPSLSATLEHLPSNASPATNDTLTADRFRAFMVERTINP